MFYGSITAMITPFRDGEIDWKALEELIERQIENGTHGLVPCGTTGESPTLTHDEHKRIVERCVDQVKGRIPVIAGTGSNSTAEALDFTDHALKAGADAALIVTPYYNKPTQDGLYAHYKTLAESVNIPIIIYNIPGRSVIDMTTQTMAKLAELPNIIGVKDATNDLNRVIEIKEQIGDDFCQLSGEDPTIAQYLKNGGHGCISVTSNLVPDMCAKLHNLWKDGKEDEVLALHEKLIPLHEAMFCETSPQPVKYALSQLGICSDEVRLPLVKASAAARQQVDQVMTSLGLAQHSNAA